MSNGAWYCLVEYRPHLRKPQKRFQVCQKSLWERNTKMAKNESSAGLVRWTSNNNYERPKNSGNFLPLS